MARVRVVEPMTGSVVEVDGDSHLAKAWKAEKPAKPEPAKPEPAKVPVKKAAAKKVAAKKSNN